MKLLSEAEANELFYKLNNKSSTKYEEWLELAFSFTQFLEVLSDRKDKGGKTFECLIKAYNIDRKGSQSHVIKILGQQFKTDKKTFLDNLHKLQEVILEKAKFLEESLELCEWGIKIDSNDKISWYNKGYCLWRLSQREPNPDTVSEFKNGKLILHVPDPRQQVHFKHEANRCFMTALEIDPNFKQAQKAADLWEEMRRMFNVNIRIAYDS